MPDSCNGDICEKCLFCAFVWTQLKNATLLMHPIIYEDDDSTIDLESNHLQHIRGMLSDVKELVNFASRKALDLVTSLENKINNAQLREEITQDFLLEDIDSTMPAGLFVSDEDLDREMVSYEWYRFMGRYDNVVSTILDPDKKVRVYMPLVW